MKDEALQKVAEITTDWAYMQELPVKIHNFQLQRLQQIHEDKYDLYSYANGAAHRSVTAYFHAETNEYKLRIQLGSFEFCLTECIAPSLETFEHLLCAQFNEIVSNLAEFKPAKVDALFESKHIVDWQFAFTLPERLEDFELFIRPSQPFRITNGSYIILDYEHFPSQSNFAIYYNVFRDEFFSDSRVAAVPDTDYEFDSHTLEELQDRISSCLAKRLKAIRTRAEKELYS
ncbi:MAG: hypothetical protein J6Z82_05060 [Schwartzia sp.]|nr:hypothetical protein [Schwartzia sp. (in: firmicutes)]